MTQEEFNLIVEDRFKIIRDLFTIKSKEYQTNGDVFSNFKGAAGGLSFHQLPEKVLWEFVVKHFQSIKDIMDDIEKGKLPTTGKVEEKMGDVLLYMLLLEGMLYERIDNNVK